MYESLKNSQGVTQGNVPNEGGVCFFGDFRPICCHIWKTVHFRHKVILQVGNRKPYASYRLVLPSMTLSDPWPGFQGHGSFKRRMSPKRRILQTQLLYRTLIGHHTHAIDKQASYTAYNPTALTWIVQTFRKRRAGLSATAGLSCWSCPPIEHWQLHHLAVISNNSAASWVSWWRNAVRVSDLRSSGHGFDYRSGRYQAT